MCRSHVMPPVTFPTPGGPPDRQRPLHVNTKGLPAGERTSTRQIFPKLLTFGRYADAPGARVSRVVTELQPWGPPDGDQACSSGTFPSPGLILAISPNGHRQQSDSILAEVTPIHRQSSFTSLTEAGSPRYAAAGILIGWLRRTTAVEYSTDAHGEPGMTMTAGRSAAAIR